MRAGLILLFRSTLQQREQIPLVPESGHALQKFFQTDILHEFWSTRARRRSPGRRERPEHLQERIERDAAPRRESECRETNGAPPVVAAVPTIGAEGSP